MLVALILILIALIIYVIVTYNIFVKLKKQINNSYSVIDVYLKKRFDLIPNLVEITKEYANYEKDVLTKITESLIASGRYPVACTELPMPTPNSPPEPIAIFAWHIW